MKHYKYALKQILPMRTYYSELQPHGLGKDLGKMKQGSTIHGYHTVKRCYFVYEIDDF